MEQQIGAVQLMQQVVWVTATLEAYLVEKGQAERLALAEDDLECVAVSEATGLVELLGWILVFGYG